MAQETARLSRYMTQQVEDCYNAGLVTRHKEERWRHYEATPRSEALLGTLDATRGDHR